MIYNLFTKRLWNKWIIMWLSHISRHAFGEGVNMTFLEIFVEVQFDEVCNLCHVGTVIIKRPTLRSVVAQVCLLYIVRYSCARTWLVQHSLPLRHRLRNWRGFWRLNMRSCLIMALVIVVAVVLWLVLVVWKKRLVFSWRFLELCMGSRWRASVYRLLRMVAWRELRAGRDIFVGWTFSGRDSASSLAFSCQATRS